MLRILTHYQMATFQNRVVLKAYIKIPRCIQTSSASNYQCFVDGFLDNFVPFAIFCKYKIEFTHRVVMEISNGWKFTKRSKRWPCYLVYDSVSSIYKDNKITTHMQIQIATAESNKLVEKIRRTHADHTMTLFRMLYLRITCAMGSRNEIKTKQTNKKKQDKTQWWHIR